MPAKRIFAYVQESPESGCEDIGTIEFGKRWTLINNKDLAELTTQARHAVNEVELLRSLKECEWAVDNRDIVAAEQRLHKICNSLKTILKVIEND